MSLCCQHGLAKRQELNYVLTHFAVITDHTAFVDFETSS